MAALKVLRGPERIGWRYHCIARRLIGLTYRLMRVNGELGAVSTMEANFSPSFSFVTDGERISRIYVIRKSGQTRGN